MSGARSLSAADLAVLLQKRYAPPAWAFLVNLRNATGYRGKNTTYADAVALSLWPSRGLELLGFEIKVSRGDWLRELKDPEKSASIQKYCDRWWIAAGDESIVDLAELPATWGLQVVRGRKLVTVREAPKLAPLPLERDFVCSLFRNFADAYVPRATIKATKQAEIEEAVARRLEMERAGHQHTERELENLRKRVSEFEEASGLRLGVHLFGYGDGEGRKIGEAVRAILSGEHLRAADQLSDLARRADNIRERAERAADEIRAAGQPIARETQRTQRTDTAA